MMQKSSRYLKSICTRNGRKMKGGSHVIGFATRKASHGQRDHMLQDPQVLFQAGERGKRVLKKSDAVTGR